MGLLPFVSGLCVMTFQHSYGERISVILFSNETASLSSRRSVIPAQAAAFSNESKELTVTPTRRGGKILQSWNSFGVYSGGTFV